MDGVVVTVRVPDATIRPRELSPLQFVQATMEPHKEHVTALQSSDQPSHPLPGLHDIFDDEIVSRLDVGGQRTLETIKKGVAQISPFELTAPDPIQGKDSR